MLLLDVLVTYLPIADLPEYMIQTYLPGDDCLDHCETIDRVFNRIYREFTDECEYTCLDPDSTILHSFDGKPAIIYSNGTTRYYKNGELHRDGDEPAFIGSDGTIEYYKNGQFHRDGDEPAKIDSDGWKYYYKNGIRHRDGDKPAVIQFNGTLEYWKNGELHRDGDEPAVIWTDGTREIFQYWQNGNPRYR